ncbi:hypothetical protein [Scytonema sp. NUACC26]|uniref:hypothetical protein n=1 Tax=Scytonema sp. NUACC26 TaxID=3140176 RepID=UPI0038B31E4E
MATRTVTTNGVNEQMELLSEADVELFSEADVESIETESLEAEIESQLEETLESVSFETVAEDVEAYMEGDLERFTPSRYANRQQTKVFAALIKNAVKKIASNPRTRAKLQAACRKGPNAVTQLLTPIVTKRLPTYFRWMPTTYVRPIVTRLFPAICKQAGLKSGEMPAAFVGWN